MSTGQILFAAGTAWFAAAIIAGVFFMRLARMNSARARELTDTTGGNQDGHPEGHAEKRAARAGGVNNRAA